jgi:hypothetical protein
MADWRAQSLCFLPSVLLLNPSAPPPL